MRQVPAWVNVLLSVSVWPISAATRFLIDQTIKTIRFPARISIILRNVGNWLAQLILLRAGEFVLRSLNVLKRARETSYRPIPRRVLMVVPAIARGGCQRRLIATAEGLIEQGYVVDILVLKPAVFGEAVFEAEFKKLGAKFANDFGTRAGSGTAEACHPLLSHVLFLPNERECARALAHAICSFRPEVVHGWGDQAAIMAGMVACLLGVPRVILGQWAIAPVNYCASDLSIYLTRYRALLKNPTVTLVTNSRAAAADYEQWIGLPKNTVPVVYNGLLPTTVRVPKPAEVADYRASLGFPAGVPVIGSLARFEHQKDPMLWLQTAAEILRTRADARFLLAGHGSLRDDIMSLVATLGLENRCVVQGPVKDVGLIYAALDVFLLTSHFEGLPNALIELQSVGCPIVSTDYLGVGEAMIESVTGFIVPERSPIALAQRVMDVLDDEAWARSARTQGRAFVRDRFSYQRMAAETIKLYWSQNTQTSTRLSGLQAQRTKSSEFYQPSAPPTVGGPVPR